MKTKLFFFFMGIASVISVSGQGYINFSGPARGVWTWWPGWGVPRLYPTANVAFLWGTGVPLVNTLAVSTPTNGVVYYNPDTAWNDILNDPNFQLAVDANTDAPIITPSLVNGGWQYSPDPTPVLGTTPGDYVIFVIAWSDDYSTPDAAAAARSLVGWSAPFNYSFVNQIGTPRTLSGSGFQPFSVFIPEPEIGSLIGMCTGLFALRRLLRSDPRDRAVERQLTL